MINLSINKELITAHGKMNLEVEALIDANEFVSIYGVSGVGKTSLIKMIAGLMDPDNGKITVGNEPWFDSQKKLNLKSQKRNVGYVFQEFALFPNMTVEENLLFALPKGESKSFVDELISFTQLNNLKHRKPDSLSGGQQQRVAIARALIQRPKILLLDEPFSSLDIKMRLMLQEYLLKLHHEYKLTTIMVSHDISEIMRMSDRMIKLDRGKVVANGKPSDILFDRKISGKFKFIGEVIEKSSQDAVIIFTILVGQDLVKVVGEQGSTENIQLGDQVMIASKAFNPIIQKI